MFFRIQTGSVFSNQGGQLTEFRANTIGDFQSLMDATISRSRFVPPDVDLVKQVIGKKSKTSDKLLRFGEVMLKQKPLLCPVLIELVEQITVLAVRDHHPQVRGGDIFERVCFVENCDFVVGL